MSASDSPVVTPSASVADVIGPGLARRTPLESPPRFSSIRRSFGVQWLLCLALVIIADRFFFAQPLGWTTGAFSLLLAMSMAARSSNHLHHWAWRGACIALIGLCLSLVEHPGPLRITMTLLALASLAAIDRFGWTTSATAWVSRWSETMARSFVQLPIDVLSANRWTRKHGGRAARTMRTIVNWSIPVVLSMVFIGLFALANPLIARWIQQAGDSISLTFSNLFDVVTIGRMFLWLAFALGTWAFLRGRWRLSASRRGVAESSIAKPIVSPGSAALPALLVRCLILFNIVFAIQMGLDLATMLTSGALLPDGMDYRTYARRGSYPLVATALLAAAFVLVTFPSGREGEAAMQNSNAMRWARRLVYLWIAQNILLTASAGWRLIMYVEAFSLTHLRVAAAIWMLLVAIGLASIIWRIARHRTNAWLVRVNMVSLLAVLYACCFINFDSRIVWYDVKHCVEGGVAQGHHLDREYLRSLGPEAIEPFEWLANRTSNAEFADRLRDDVAMLKRDLQFNLRTWQGWTWRRATIAAASG